MSSQSRKSKGNIKYCRECGAEVYENEKRCWNCNAKTTDRKKLCIVLSVLCVIFALTSMVSCGGGSSSSDDEYISSSEGTEASTTTEDTSEDSKATKDEDKAEKREKKKDKVQDVDALEFATLYNENQLSYSKKYNGKKVRITSTINDMSVNPFDSSEWKIVLESGYSDILSGTIDCILSSDGKDKSESYKKGDTITIVGTVDDSYTFNATLKACDIEE